MIEALMFVAGTALGVAIGSLVTIFVLGRECRQMLAVAGMTTGQAQLILPDPEPEERVDEALGRLLAAEEVSEMAREVMRIAQDAGSPVTEEQAREEAERILFSGSMLTT